MEKKFFKNYNQNTAAIFYFCVLPILVLSVIEIIGTIVAFYWGLDSMNPYLGIILCMVILKFIFNFMFGFKTSYHKSYFLHKFVGFNLVYWFFVFSILFTVLL